MGAFERVEGVDALDEVRIERAPYIAFFELLEDMDPGVSGTEKEPDFGEVRIRVGLIREGDFGDVELEAAFVCEAELVKGDDGSPVGSDRGGPDLGGAEREEGGEEREEEDGEGAMSERHRFGVWNLGQNDQICRCNSLSLSLSLLLRFIRRWRRRRR